MVNHLEVNGKKVIEKDEHGNVVSEKDYGRVRAGYQAALHNPATSVETKRTAEKMLRTLESQHGEAPVVHHDNPEHNDEVHLHRVIGSYKAVLHRPTASDEAKRHAKEVLREMGALSPTPEPGEEEAEEEDRE
ncbi:SPOSA6832_03494 [Sporobolomyces salmonicolor]|uniref:SPOSA6832_03494-mRNA-1:cds n=1 Tax=Sporidiobolus salmonicolor TaxID=5005 RepID=A0A0D6EPE7_SPOSA|nr:SPOSA6832_03494 [Sporobolomyces salmonicolor]